HCGDLWLGFEAGQLSDWAQAAGLENRAELFLAQRNGFQIQVRLFQRKK
ncbi:MAG: ArsR family transcriptional regulator, partial [Cellvibrionales bacterium]|nr:ArsR family transcriptional regulator [Cellvibrionales bacterium]